MDQYTVSFFGHRVIEDPLLIEQRLETLIPGGAGWRI